MTRLPFSGASNSGVSDELLSAYLDGEVNDAERRRVEQALAADASVQRRLSMFAATQQLLHEMPTVAAPRAFVLSEEQVLAAGGRVKGATQPGFFGRWLPGLLPLATVAVAAALIIVVGMDVWGGLGGVGALPAAAPQVMEIAPAAPAVEAPAAEAPMEAPAVAAIEAQTTAESEARVLDMAGADVAAEGERAPKNVSGGEPAPLRAPSAESVVAPTMAPQPTPVAPAEKPVEEAEIAAAPAAAEEAPMRMELQAHEAQSPLVADEGAIPETGAAAESEAVALQPLEAPAPAPAPSAPRPSGLRLIEGVLLALLIILLGLAIWQRLRAHSAS